MKMTATLCLAVMVIALGGCAYKGYNPYRDGEPGRRDKGGIAMINPVTKDGRVLGYDREGYYGTRSYEDFRYRVRDDSSDRYEYDDCDAPRFDQR